MLKQTIRENTQIIWEKVQLDDGLRLSIIVPAYNEAGSLRQNIGLIQKAASEISDSYEIVIAEDGCSDETTRVVAGITSDNSKIIHLHSDHRLGKGLALKNAFRESKGQALIFMDADLSTDLNCLNEVIELVENGYDLVVGSRFVKGAFVNRSIFRNMASRAYNLLVKLLFRDDVSDHQCGFKGFKNQSLKHVIDDIVENGYLFDTELIVRMKQKGLNLAEIPVKWQEPENRTPRFSLFTDGIKMGLSLVRLRLNLWACRKQEDICQTQFVT